MSLPATETAQALGEILAGRDLSQARAAKLAGTSQPFLNQVATGRRKPSAEWVDLIAAALALSPEESERLHRAAAKDHGFRIDLTERRPKG
ncbi:helix-turn-helix domain-containing protein [Rubellimicrobium roseum]|uniref:helix-turn-helix domain-containing protein n=1 Tax=Rubellimicrobium roseum TaxID=687525 RepID=UPI001C3F36D5|nr:helix-turn-helix transcriptional regulator [Rubellimicrobium roseum]